MNGSYGSGKFRNNRTHKANFRQISGSFPADLPPNGGMPNRVGYLWRIKNRTAMPSPCIVGFLFLLSNFVLNAQVFIPPTDNAAGLALGGALAAAPDWSRGVSNDAQPALGQGTAVFAGTALPFSLPGWQAHQFQAVWKPDAGSGLAVELQHAGLEAYREQQFRAAYGRRLGEKILLGAHAQYLRVSAPEYGAAGGISGGLSMLAEPMPRCWFGARLQHPLGAKLAGRRLPARLQLGAAWRISDALLLLLETDKELERPAQVKVGGEYAPSAAARIRLGVRSAPTRTAFGLGFRLKNGVLLDAGAEWHPNLGLTTAFMVSWQKT
jgi:hypothetical protein